MNRPFHSLFAMSASAESTPSSSDIASAVLTPDALPVGTPLAWPVVDRDGTLLFERGAMLVNDSERAFLFEHFAPCRGDALPASAEAAGPHADAANEPPPAPASVRDMHLTIGASMGLRTQVNGGSPMQPCRLIGFAPNGALFVTPPHIDGHPMPLLPGENIEMVAIASQAVFRFVCTVLTLHQAPLDYVVLSAPAAIRRLRQRKSIRVNARIPVRYGIGDEGIGYDGIGLAKGISAVGLSLTASLQLGAVGDRVRIAFRLRSAALDAPVETTAIIRNVQPARGDDPSIAHGLELDHLTPAEQIAMKAYVFDRQEDLMYWSGGVK
ncbi:c-di-GMP-binding flagellar brake protein YcgR [Paraburkholderia caballeronis]|nr:c-di-GMP-binding flagellar brake protein YcgR [Paraburkholderia caballeronis]TDV07973.1 c-di-GMP-binding flagellar brake protein YcgR [Paraburkholderia caballeronis]TDV18699.1 c-di-GMP-binding flagellar brake protein YcgR [Paraburkholderia caballeronis]TDV33770.1 c-di-GMP-binding flagellar brake protein YcgR [Paraburkholderia caballeronis]